MLTAPPDLWKNPYQRYGYVDVNVLIGEGIEPSDAELFFGPIWPSDRFLFLPDSCPSMPLLLSHHLQLFASGKEAERKGYTRLIRNGYTDLFVTQWGRKHHVCILKIESLFTNK